MDYIIIRKKLIYRHNSYKKTNSFIHIRNFIVTDILLILKNLNNQQRITIPPHCNTNIRGINQVPINL